MDRKQAAESHPYHWPSIGEWIAILLLCALKAEVVRISYQMQGQMRALSSLPEGCRALVSSAVLPLIFAAANHVADIRLAWCGCEGAAWVNLMQSVARTWFFIVPQAVLAGHNVDLAGSHRGVGICFLGVAVWLQLPRVPRKLFYQSGNGRSC